MKIEETFRVKQEHTEEQTDLVMLKEKTQELNEMEEKEQYEKHCDLTTGEKSTQTEKTSSCEKPQKTKSNRYFTCHQCGKCFLQNKNIST
ncbi:Zinc finger protein 8 [Labeo rohita]|uniref:Zinc finger protein 8 n=1 Tax=Labeo rohita TaxID=84645 RepID=A0ABQ8L1L8_LABRO|nr:Zinc finger protein 8 [Labeo rohita]